MIMIIAFCLMEPSNNQTPLLTLATTIHLTDDGRGLLYYHRFEVNECRHDMLFFIRFSRPAGFAQRR